MTYAEINALIKSMGLPVTYHHWQPGKVPPLPYLVFWFDDMQHFAADNTMYQKILSVQLELYSNRKNFAAEEKVERVLDANEIVYEKYEEYIDTEKVKAFRLADNRVGEIAEWDYNLLEAELAEIENINMQSFNFDVSEINPDDFGENFDLPDGEKPEICTMSFTLHQKQKELVEYALGIVQNEVSETFGNTNKNGNALYEVIRQWAEQRKSL